MIIAERCRADRWPTQVVGCLERAHDDYDAQEVCLHGLSKPQGAALERAFEPLHAELGAKRKAKDLATASRAIKEARLDELAARDPACADYAAAVASARSAQEACKADDSLARYALGGIVRGDAEALRALSDPQQLAAECAVRAKTMRSELHRCE